MYNLLVITIGVVAITYIIWSFYKRLQKQGDWCCECSSCNNDAKYCGPPENSLNALQRKDIKRDEVDTVGN
ncbi:MAG: FeoB-associated Cys-rich membrane protein [Deltaproteobacteria bacterium]|nr:FeoB-associated Cys-rich membrane protein [Deltaproteobacteria bacterium]MBW2333616.1 FeoB-associated Cys-rich membrane protein [Deltaproteobacteria bacterium]